MILCNYTQQALASAVPCDRENLPQYLPRGALDHWKRAPDCGCGDLNWLS